MTVTTSAILGYFICDGSHILLLLILLYLLLFLKNLVVVEVVLKYRILEEPFCVDMELMDLIHLIQQVRQ